MLESLFNKVADLKVSSEPLETLTQVFSDEYCEIFKIIILKNIYEHLLL